MTDGRRRWRLVRARSDAIPDSLRRLMARARETRPRWSVVPWREIGLAATALAFLGWLVFYSPVLGVREVEVTGLVELPEAQVRETAAVVMGTPLTRLDASAIADRVRGLKPVGAVDVSRVWPSTLRIAVTERVPVGGVKRDNAFELFDGQGVLFRTAESLPGGVAHVELTVVNQLLIDGAARVIGSLTPELRESLVTLKVDGPAGYELVLPNDRTVIWGDAEENDTKAKVATALLKQKGKRIDVSVPEIVTIQ
ncbi:cell division protein FtsQ/DivIB [Allorhizocola rhizosphaerae]|uniref:cell division protein FtsQ/DivIB n=1 Tax=Allorhizocola rhizosphaerae TaxID=1872709 RepID=UPI000E3E0D61|nr:FtsQ-type POTRA domain-containing protein [Allorhizocola rhizosphaerae]